MTTPQINLHKIFCHLVSDENFLSTVVQTGTKDFEQKKIKKQGGCKLMTNMVSEYGPLSPYETQPYAMLPFKVKSFLTPEYARMGVKNMVEKNLSVVNISFLNSLNILVRPELYHMTLDDQIKNLNLFEDFVCHMIQKNYQIDKIKNTKKVQAVNKELVRNLKTGIISHDLIQAMINIFEINLLVFDLTKMEIYFYWSKGTKYPFLNLFKNIYCMSFVQGNYEPIMTNGNVISEEERRKIYVQVLTNILELKCMPPIKLSIYAMTYLSTWKNIDEESYVKIVQQFYHQPIVNVDAAFDQLENLLPDAN